MDNKQTIAIFADNLRILAFLSLESELKLDVVGYLHKEQKSSIVELIETLKTNPPAIRKENITEEGISVTSEFISAEDTQFLEAVAEELKSIGFIAKVVPKTIKSIIVYISVKLTPEERSKILGDLANLPYEIEENAIKELEATFIDLTRLRDKKLIL